MVNKTASMVKAGDLKVGHLIHVPKDPPGRFRRITFIGYWNPKNDANVVWFECGAAFVFNTRKGAKVMAKTTR